jgi:hypothetical protein
LGGTTKQGASGDSLSHSFFLLMQSGIFSRSSTWSKRMCSMPYVGGIATDVIAQRYKAGESIAELADDYDRSQGEIEEAIRCELYREAA